MTTIYLFSFFFLYTLCSVFGGVNIYSMPLAMRNFGLSQ